MSRQPRSAKKRKVTMKDVATLAGVSMMTVSRVLNNDKVSRITYKRVMDAVEQLNYRLNVSARSLSGSQSYLLGFFYDNSLGSYISQYLIGVLKRCNELGYHLVLESCSFDAEDVVEAVERLTRRYALDGIILPPPMSESKPLLDALDAANLRYVRVGPGSDLERAPYVTIDDYQAAFAMTEHLIENGHRDIGFIKGDFRQGVAAIRYRGFIDALAHHGLKENPQLVVEGDFNFASGLQAGEKIIAAQVPVTAIFSSNDDMASGLLWALAKHGLKVPDDVAVAGFDDTTIARSVWPPLTTVRQPIDEMSARSVDLLMESIKVDRVLNAELDKHETLPYSIVVRESTVRNKSTSD